MSLKGSLQTVALPEVLQFLSNTGKSGEFHVSGTRGDGHLWFDAGRIVGLQAARAEQPFEAIFELLRIEDGEFTFAADVERPTDVAAVAEDAGEVAPALEAAQARLAEWRDIVEVVPSLSHRLQLRADGPTKRVSLDPDQWAMIAAIGGGQTVDHVIDDRGLQEFDGCKSIRHLVEASLVEVLEPATEPDAADEPEVVDDVLAEPVFDDPAVHVDAVEPVLVDEPSFSGELLRFGADPVAEAVADHGFEAVNGDHSVAESAEDHYAALRAAVVEVEDFAGSDEGVEDEHADGRVYEVHSDPDTDPRAALQALLSEVTTPADASGEVEVVDGLADRGPWTDHELSTMDSDGGWDAGEGDTQEQASNIVPFAPVHHPEDEEHHAYADQPVATEVFDGQAEDGQAEPEEPEEEASPEPINRGLLLKFLSSVRN